MTRVCEAGDTVFFVNISLMGLFYAQALLSSFPFTHLTREPY